MRVKFAEKSYCFICFLNNDLNMFSAVIFNIPVSKNVPRCF